MRAEHSPLSQLNFADFHCIECLVFVLRFYFIGCVNSDPSCWAQGRSQPSTDQLTLMRARFESRCFSNGHMQCSNNTLWHAFEAALSPAQPVPVGTITRVAVMTAGGV